MQDIPDVSAHMKKFGEIGSFLLPKGSDIILRNYIFLQIIDQTFGKFLYF